jgi:hypothetical protein
MRTIEVRNDTYEQLAFAARVFGVDVAEVVARLVGAMPSAEVAQADPGADSGDQPSTNGRLRSGPDEEEEVKIHAVYQGRRISAVFMRSTAQVRVTSEPLAGRCFSSPSAAAVAVVGKLNPGREFPHTNGRTFWVIDATGKNLRSIVGRR